MAGPGLPGQNGRMTTYAIRYEYDGRSAERDALRPDHRAYLAGLAEQGVALAYGRFDDDGDPGAVLLFEAGSTEQVQELLAADPFVVAGLVPRYEVRRWAGVFAPPPAS